MPKTLARFILLLLWLVCPKVVHSQDTAAATGVSYTKLVDAYAGIAYSNTIKLNVCLGVHYKYAGAEFGGAFNSTEMPKYDSTLVPDTSFTEHRYKQSTTYFNITGGYEVASWVFPYAKLGLAFEEDSVLHKHTSTGKFYTAPPESASVSKTTVMYGAGALFYPFRRLVIGASWTNISGPMITIGYTLLSEPTSAETP